MFSDWRMLSIRTRRFVPAALALSLLSCITAKPSEPVAPRRVVIAGITDIHGWISGHPQKVGNEALTQGGLPGFSAYMKNLRAANPDQVVIVAAGDLFQGTLESNLAEGAPVVDAFNAIGVDASAIGNHEFDYGPVGPDSLVRTAGQDALGALKKNIERARFGLLAANVREKATGRRPEWARPHMLVERNGVKVGIVGLITVETPTTTAPANVASLLFDDAAAPAIQAAKELRAAGADVIVVAAHIGGICGNMVDPQDLSSCEIDHEAFKLAEALPPGTVDVIFGGHTHREVRHVVNGVPVLQAAALGRAFSSIELEVDTAGNRVVNRRIREHQAVCDRVIEETGGCDTRAKLTRPAVLVKPSYEGAAVTPDAAVEAVIAPYVQRAEAMKREPLGVTLAGEFTSDRNGESTLGNLMADALRVAVPDAQIAILNSGGLRAPLRSSSPNYGDLYAVIPFDNATAILDMTGAEIEGMLRAGTNARHGLFQVSGLRFTVVPEGNERRLGRVMLADGTPLDPSRTYKVATSDFLAAGGDDLMEIMNAIPEDRKAIRYDLPLRDTVARGLRQLGERGPLAPKTEGRITAER